MLLAKITPPLYKYLLYKLTDFLPEDILKYIEDFLQVSITTDKIYSTIGTFYHNNDIDIVSKNLSYIKKYARNFTFIFDEYSPWAYWHDSLEQATFGNLTMRLFRTDLQHHQTCTSLIIDFIRNIIFNTNGIECLVNKEILLTYGRDYYDVSTILDSLFGIVFSPDHFINELERTTIWNVNYRHKYDDEVTHDFDHYLDLLKDVLFDREYEIVIISDELYTSTGGIKLVCHELKYETSLFNIFSLLCHWKTESLYPYIANMMTKLRYDKNLIDNNENKRRHKMSLSPHCHRIKYLITLAIHDNGNLLLDALFSSEVFLKYYGNMITDILKKLDLKTIKNMSRYKNIQKFLTSSCSMFKLVECRKYKSVRYFFNKYKKKMSEFRNNKGHSLLEVACESRGLNQNIIHMFVNSGLFNYAKPLMIKNKKVRAMFT